MSIKVIKRRANVRPVGVVQTDSFNADAKLAQDIANAGTAMMGLAYEQGAKEAKQRGEQTAMQTQLTVLAPEDGFVKKVEAPESFGRIAETSFNETMTRRFSQSINHSMKQSMARLQNDPELRADPIAFKQKASTLLASYVNASDPSLKGIVQQSGTEYLSSALTNVTLNQHKTAFTKLAYSTENELRTSLNELVDFVKTGDLDSAMTLYQSLENEIQDSASMLRQEQFTSLMDDLTNNFIQASLSKYSVGKTKSAMNNILGLWNKRAYQEKGMPKEIQEAIDRLPQDGRLDKMHEEIRRHLSTLVSTSGVGVGSNINFGSGPAGNAVDAVMKSSANIPEDGSADNEVLVNDQTQAIDFFSPQYAQVVRTYGHLGNDMSNLLKRYMANTINDPNGQYGFGLYQIWSNLTVTQENGRFVFNSQFYENSGAKDYDKAMRAISQYLDIDTTPEQYRRAWSFYNATKADKDKWTTAISTQLKVDNNETAVRNKIRSMLQDHSMSAEEAELFVDEVVLYQAMSIFDGTNLSTEDAISKIARTVNNDFKEDSAIINPNGFPAFSYQVNRIDNPNAGQVVGGLMGVYTKSSEYFERKQKMPFHQRTRFALKTVFDEQGMPGGADTFKFEIEGIAKRFLLESDLEIDEEMDYKLGRDIFLMPNPNSTVQNPQYSVLFKHPDNGTIQPVLNNGVQMVYNAEDFKYKFAQMKKIGMSTYMKGQMEMQKRIDAEKKEQAKYRNYATTSGMIGLSAGLAEGQTLQDMDLGFMNDESLFDFFQDSLKTTTDFFHNLIFGSPAKATIGEGIESLERFNPTNIRYSKENKWQGSFGDDGTGFESFEDMASAFRATGIILQNYNSNHFNHEMTLRQMINRWAPPSENDTESYIKFMEQTTGFNDTDIIDTGDYEVLVKVIKAMTKLEIGATAFSSYANWEEDIRDGLSMI